MSVEEEIADILLSEFGRHFGQANAVRRVLEVVEREKRLEAKRVKGGRPPKNEKEPVQWS